MHENTRPGGPLDIIRTVREARSADGQGCPHCHGRSIVRWGGFSGRQRYRCKSCRKTFSDLTRTAFAYSKKIAKWPHYLVLVRQSQTLRSAADRMDVHVSTAFRWRHRLMSHMTAADGTTLTGQVEVKELLFAHSNKGHRRLHETRQRGARSCGTAWNECPRDRVLLAVSRMGIVHSIMIGGDAVVIEDVRAWATARLSGRCTVYGLMPRAGPCGSPIRGAGHDYQMVR
ncbi:MAG: transposase, partial [Longimicrobiales bacterium]